MQRPLFLLFMALVIAGCRGGAGTVQVDVRNVSAEAITLVTEEPGPFLFANTNSHVIQPWKEGQCFAHLGLYSGHIKVTVSGSSIHAPRTYETTAVSPSDKISIQIDENGYVQFGGAIPDDVLPCESGGY